MGYLIFKVVTGMMNKIPFVTLMIKIHMTEALTNYECGLKTLEKRFLAKRIKFILCYSKSYYFPIIHG